MIADREKEQRQKKKERERRQRGWKTETKLTGTVMEMSMMETLRCEYYDQTEKTTRALNTSSFECYYMC